MTSAAGRSVRSRAVGGYGRVALWLEAAVDFVKTSSYFWAVVVGLLLGLATMVNPILALILVVGVVVLVVSVEQPLLLGYLLITAITLTGGTERDRFVPVLVPNELGLVFAAGLLVPTLVLVRRRANKDFRIVTLAFVFLVVGTVGIPVVDFMLRGIALDIDNALKLVGPLQYFLVFWVFTVIADTEKKRHQLLLYMMGCGAVVAFIGLLQAAKVGIVVTVLGNFFASAHTEASLSSDAGRITSVIGAWNALGIYMMACIVIAWAVLPQMKTKIDRSVTLGCMSVCGLTLLASGSFAGIIGVVIGVFLVSHLTNRLTRMLGLAISGVLALSIGMMVAQSILLPVVEQRIEFQYGNGESFVPRTLTDRFDIWRDVFITPIREHFPRAVYPTVPRDYPWLWEESQYIMLLFRTGLAGFLGHIIWVGILFGWLRSRAKGITQSSQVAAAALTILIVLSLGGFTNAVFNYSGSVDYLWILFAFVVASKAEVDTSLNS